MNDCDISEFQVEIGDIIILSSDGLYDVLPDHIIEETVARHDPKVQQFYI